MAKKKAPARQIPDGKSQVNFNVDNTQLEKLKVIAGLHSLTHSEVYNQAFDKFIELYEKKNGEVKTGPKSKEIKL